MSRNLQSKCDLQRRELARLTAQAEGTARKLAETEIRLNQDSAALTFYRAQAQDAGDRLRRIHLLHKETRHGHVILNGHCLLCGRSAALIRKYNER